MNGTNPAVDVYFAEGCGRCSLVRTPACKALIHNNALRQLRAIILETGLTEERKWSHPVYTLNGKNVAILGALKECSTIGFFKGALLQDSHQLLEAQTENMQSTRIIRFKNEEHVQKLASVLQDYIRQAIEVEHSGQKVNYKKVQDYDVPEELTAKFDELPAFKTAFFALTPGRQRGYLLHFAAPKQAKTRTARIEKLMQQIFDGKGLRD